MPKLQISLPDGSEATHELTDDAITLGRLPDNAIEISDPSVSSRHAVLTRQNGDYALKDIGSTNGTKLNGRPIAEEEEHPLQDGDNIVFGHIAVVYSSETPAEPRPLPVEEATHAVAAESSVRPADFANASPFQTKGKKKDPASTAILVFGIVAILAFGAAVASIFTMKSPL